MKISKILADFQLNDYVVCLHPMEEEILTKAGIVNDLNIPGDKVISSLKELATLTSETINLKSTLIEVKYTSPSDIFDRFPE